MGSRDYGTHPVITGRMTFLSTVAIVTLQVKIVKQNFFLFCKSFTWGSVTVTSRFLGYGHSKISSFTKWKKAEFGALETMAANMNKHEIFYGVISFEEMNFSKTTTENNSANNLPFLQMKKSRQIYMIRKEIYRNYGIQNLRCFFHRIIRWP